MQLKLMGSGESKKDSQIAYVGLSSGYEFHSTLTGTDACTPVKALPSLTTTLSAFTPTRADSDKHADATNHATLSQQCTAHCEEQGPRATFSPCFCRCMKGGWHKQGKQWS